MARKSTLKSLADIVSDSLDVPINAAEEMKEKTASALISAARKTRQLARRATAASKRRLAARKKTARKAVSKAKRKTRSVARRAGRTAEKTVRRARSR